MAQIKTPPVSFNLLCQLTCAKTQYHYINGDGSISVYETVDSVRTKPETASRIVTFAIDIPNGSTIESARVYATTGTPMYGADTNQINGVPVGVGESVSVDVEIPDGATTVDVPFRFLCGTPSHTHSITGPADKVWTSDDGTWGFNDWYYSHESSMSYTDVYLLIEYTPPFTPPTLIPYTDPRLYVGETYVKAAHMTELHTNANLVRTAYHLPAYDFPPIVARESLLARWNEDVIELRVALDEIGVEHEEWLVLDFNRPRLDVLLQLRRVVAALARGGEQEETDGVQLYTSDGALLMDANGLYFKAWEGN